MFRHAVPRPLFWVSISLLLAACSSDDQQSQETSTLMDSESCRASAFDEVSPPGKHDGDAVLAKDVAFDRAYVACMTARGYGGAPSDS